MEAFVNGVWHVLIVAAMVGIVIALLMGAVRAPNLQERLFRLLAIFLGTVLILGLHVTGITFAAIPTDLGSAIWIGLIFGAVGLIVGNWMVSLFRRDDDKALRVLSFVGSLVLATIFVLYIAATTSYGWILGVSVVPSLAFIGTTGLVFLFRSKATSSTANES